MVVDAGGIGLICNSSLVRGAERGRCDVLMEILE